MGQAFALLSTPDLLGFGFGGNGQWSSLWLLLRLSLWLLLPFAHVCDSVPPKGARCA